MVGRRVTVRWGRKRVKIKNEGIDWKKMVDVEQLGERLEKMGRHNESIAKLIEMYQLNLLLKFSDCRSVDL